MRDGARKSYVETDPASSSEGERRGQGQGQKQGQKQGQGQGRMRGGRNIKTQPHESETDPLAPQNPFAPENFEYTHQAQRGDGFGGYAPVTTEEEEEVYGFGVYAPAGAGVYASDLGGRIKAEPDADADAGAIGDATDFTAEEVLAQRQGVPLSVPMSYAGFSAFEPAV
ncbi:hypothetical protein BDV97DRAFT_357429 [Delphinella strobiligena]|nr:hypothetical protein BDV97DRAFT_357429 [Delphinella strobiligena]